MVRPCGLNAPRKVGEASPVGPNYGNGLRPSFDVKPAELSEVAENREVFRVLLGLLLPREDKRV